MTNVVELRIPRNSNSSFDPFAFYGIPRPEVKGPTEEQEQAMDLLRGDLRSNQIVALTGDAGTGKTTTLRYLLRKKEDYALAATTNKAAVRLTQVTGRVATTVHKAALRPVFDEPYASLDRWMKAAELGDIGPMPGGCLAVWPALIPVPEKVECGLLVPDEIPNFLKINPFDWLIDWTAKDKSELGVLVIDEASMLDMATLAPVLDVFDRTLIVGDPNQLKPIDKDTAPALQRAEVTRHLYEVHRQAAGSPVIQLAHAIKDGKPYDILPLYRRITAEDIRSGMPIITWRNKRREALARIIRSSVLKLPDRELTPGEPLVCRCNVTRGNYQFINNATYRVTAANGRMLRLQDEFGKEVTTTVGIEDWGEFRNPLFRLGYAITAHTAQGSEWSRVAIDQQEVNAMQRCLSADERRRWLYTAVTRAAEELFFFQEFSS